MRVLLLLAILLIGVAAVPSRAQRTNLSTRELHDRVVHNLVRIRTRDDAYSSGWLLAQSGRPLVITTKSTVGRLAGVNCYFYAGSDGGGTRIQARVIRRSRRVDLAVLQLQEDPPSSVYAHCLRTTGTNVFRGERLVLGGNPLVLRDPQPMAFQTAYGSVTGQVSGQRYLQCGVERNCIVVDAPALTGDSGGPALNFQGQFVGMVWRGPELEEAVRASAPRPNMSYLIHTRTIAQALDELRQ